MEVSAAAASSNQASTGKKRQEKKASSRGSNCSLDIVFQYLVTGQCPKGYSKNDKRALKRRAQSFVVIENELYYTGGRSRHSNGEREEETAENPENYPDYTQVLRKCCLTEEERQEAVTRAHVAENGQHFGMERTTERLSSQFYWLGIIHSVRSTIHNCSNCASRTRGPSATTITSASDLAVQDDGEDIPQEPLKMEMADAYFVPQEASNFFWQKVEIQVFGPYPVGKDQAYVAVALDTYSQFPEAVVLRSLTMASLTSFVLNLVCRYGVMERLVILQNQVVKGVDVTINMHDVNQAGISITQLYNLANPTDEHWSHVERSLSHFVSTYPGLWDKCLEAFLMPLRISVPAAAEYSPTYLTFGREPNLPAQLNHKGQQEWQSEVRLSTEQEQQTVELLMLAFGLHSKTPSVPSAMQTDIQSHPQPTPKAKLASEVPSAAVKKSARKKMRRGRKRKEEHVVHNTPGDAGSDDENDIEEIAYDDNDEDFTPSTQQNHNSSPVRSSKRKRKVTYKLKEELMSRRQKMKMAEASRAGDRQPGNEAPASLHDQQPSSVPRRRTVRKGQLQKHVGSKMKKVQEEKTKTYGEAPASIAISLEQLSLDVYYFILKRFKERGTYPPHVSLGTKQAIQQLSQTMELRLGRLYSCSGKSAGRAIITQEKARFSLLRKAHTRGEVHYDHSGSLKHLRDMNVFWKGMSLDVDAFIHSCPDCVRNNPLHNKAIVCIPTKSKVLLGDRDDSDPHMSEDEEEESSYDDLIQYLTDGTFPGTLPEDQQSYIKMRADDFCIIKGSLHYQPRSRPFAAPRQVLFAESCRYTAIQEAHTEDGSHLSQQDTQAKLREKYFWSGMTYDVVRYIATCCMASSFSAPPIPHRNPTIQKLVEKFRSYYTEGIPVYDRSILMDSLGTDDVESKSKRPGTGEGEGNTASVGLAEVQPKYSLMEDEAIRKAVESIIAEMGGSLVQAVLGDTVELSAAAPPVHRTKSGKVPSRRDCHKCPHCGRFISGSVSFKVHLYKHTGIKPFSCSVCGKTFTTRKSQQVHMRKHTGVRPYLCNQCGREFFRGTSFRYHLKSHTRGKLTPLPCDLCDRTFATQNRLDRHKEFKHPAVPRVYMCNQCGKVFTAARSLKWHEQSHSSVKKYHCQYCSKSFVRKEVLENHLKLHTIDWADLAVKHDGGPQAVNSASELTVSISQPTSEIISIGAGQPPGEVVTSVIQWTDEEQRQAAERISQQSLIVTDLDVYQSEVASSQEEHTTTHVLTAAQVHPAVHLAPATLPPHNHPSIHSLQSADILLHEAVPVQYEVECLSGDPSALTEADLNAVHMLAHASLGGQNIMQHLSDRT